MGENLEDAEDGFELDVGAAEALAEGSADIAKDLEADLGLLVHELIELVGGNADELGIAVGDDGSGAFGFTEKGDFADEGPFLESGNRVAMDGCDADFSVEDDEDVVCFFGFVDDGLHIGCGEEFADPRDGGDLIIAEAIGHVAVFYSDDAIH